MSGKPAITTIVWPLIAATAFGLGWALKPAPRALDDSGAAGTGPAGKWSAGALIPDTGSGAIDPGAEDAPRSTSRARLGSKHSLGGAEIEELGLKFKTTLDPIERRFAFAKLLESLTVENAKEIREQIAHLDARSAEFIEFHYAWGKIGGKDAVMSGADTDKSDMQATLAGWASADPAAAMKWFGSLEKQSEGTSANQEYLKWGMVHGIANADPQLASKFVYDLAASGDGQATKMIGIVADNVLRANGPAGAAAWAASLPRGDEAGNALRASAMGKVAAAYAHEDPAAAAAWAAQLPGEDQTGGVLQTISQQWARRDGGAVVGWLQSLGASPGRSGAYYSAFEGWTSRNAVAAGDYLNGMPTSPERDHAIGGFVSRHRWDDPEAALAWAYEINDAGTREASLVRAGQAYYKRNAKAAREWLSQSGLSPAAQKQVISPSRR